METEEYHPARSIVTKAEIVRDKLIARLREEAGKYPGNLDDSPCEELEEPCLFSHIHEFFSTNDEVKILVGSPERIAAIAIELIIPMIGSPEAMQ